MRLTKDVIDANPANYTAWHFRRKVLEALTADLYQELRYVEAMALENPKNYQIWHHRREICMMLRDGSQEKAFSARAIEGDAKNYHAWAHRQWAIRTFQLWDGELAYIDALLVQDIRNNSAWNERFFVVKHTTPMGREDRQREIDYAFAKITIAPHNESPWNYVRGMLQDHEAHLSESLTTRAHEVLAQNPDCVFAAALLVDLYATKGTEAAVARARELLDKLEKDIDLPRAAYWQFRRSTLKVTK